MRLSRALGRKLRRNLAARQVTEAEGAARRRAREPLAGKGAIGPLGKPASSQKKLRHELYRLQRFGRAGAASVLLEQPTCQPRAWRAKTRVDRRLGGGWLGRQRQRLGRPCRPASSPESAEPPRAARGGEAARVGPGRCREGRLAMLRGPISSHSLAPVSITWPSVYSLSAAEMRLELMRWPSAWVSVDSSSCSHT